MAHLMSIFDAHQSVNFHCILLAQIIRARVLSQTRYKRKQKSDYKMVSNGAQTEMDI